MNRQHEKNKNEATPIPHNPTLREYTQSYWEISLARNGLSNSSITTQEALVALSDMIASIGPKRYLRDCAGNLISSIITPKRRRKSKHSPAPTPINSLKQSIAP